ncbi:MAG: flagellar protein FlgJ [Gammaproteobacteria bacterium]|jgi:flagellar protein FlgJ
MQAPAVFLSVVLATYPYRFIYHVRALSKKIATRIRTMTIVPTLPPPHLNVVQKVNSDDSKMREAAENLEATFLSEMLKSAGFGASRSTFGGGIGEDQFSSFLREAQAKEMVSAGGIGLAEALFEAMKADINA